MIIETILVILGILTTALGIWNIVIGAYIWGTLFLLGGIWAIGLGTLYIVQIRKERKKKSKSKESTITDTIEIIDQPNTSKSTNNSIQAIDLFAETPEVIIAGTEGVSEIEETKKPSKFSKFLSKNKKEQEPKTEIKTDTSNLVKSEQPEAAKEKQTLELKIAPASELSNEGNIEEQTSEENEVRPSIIITPPPAETDIQEPILLTEGNIEKVNINVLSIIDPGKRELIVQSENAKNELVIVTETDDQNILKDTNESDKE